MIIRRFKSSSSSSKRWLDRQLKDIFTKQSKGLNYKSRAAFKLLEINQKYRIFNGKCTNIVDLGCAPGSWSQVAINEMKKKTSVVPKILGIDLIKCGPPRGVTFLQGDFMTPEIHQQIIRYYDGQPIQLLLSDMMTNTTGMKDIDHLGSMDLCQSVVQLADKLLAKNGNLVMKFFMGHEQPLLESTLKDMFQKAYRFKPVSSRDELREMYLVALKKKLVGDVEKVEQVEEPQDHK